MKKKFCDKCEKSEQETEIKRIAFQTHFPNYDYFGLDLCEKCLIELKVLLADFLNQEEKVLITEQEQEEINAEHYAKEEKMREWGNC